MTQFAALASISAGLPASAGHARYRRARRARGGGAQMGRQLTDAILISVLRVSMLRAGRCLVGLPRRQLYPQQETISAPLSELPLSATLRPEHLQQRASTEAGRLNPPRDVSLSSALPR